MTLIEQYEDYLEKSNKTEKERFEKIYSKQLNIEDPINDLDPRSNALLLWNQERLIDTRIRNINNRLWEDFKQFCRDESLKKHENISANTMLKKLIEDAVIDWKASGSDNF